MASSSSTTLLRRARHLSTAATAATNLTNPSPMTISKAKSKLRKEHDTDKALDIYSTVKTNHSSSSPGSTHHAQQITVRRLAKSHRFKDIETLIESHKNDPRIVEEQFLSSLIKSYGIAGMFDHALKTYTQMDTLKTPRSSLSFNALLTACLNSKRGISYTVVVTLRGRRKIGIRRIHTKSDQNNNLMLPLEEQAYLSWRVTNNVEDDIQEAYDKGGDDEADDDDCYIRETTFSYATDNYFNSRDELVDWNKKT
ncbi:small ribosomal subunit protein mL103 (rPPR7)-like [Bidens hawaiensis]|uniref:small ribosomal subunit protein mL103 (rPPR7)-like n=1 Tax=Bidens hawaiensis TaxID=980011 RepID=UPI00404A87FA